MLYAAYTTTVAEELKKEPEKVFSDIFNLQTSVFSCFHMENEE